jgi:RimJ/RimL family protein N-acetyltransferase
MMPHKTENIVIQRMQVDDVEPTTRLLMRMWLDTYVNEKVGVSEEWVKNRFKEKLTPDKIAERKQKLTMDQKNPNKESFVAKDIDGNVIGMIGYSRTDNGEQELGAIYVDKRYQGRGISGMLIAKLLEWAIPKEPIILGVVEYNERAKAFYKKWGFKEIKGSEKLFDNKIPEITMIRKGKNDEI